MLKPVTTRFGYRTYGFEVYDPVVDDICAVIPNSGKGIKKISGDSDVHKSTLINWLDRQVRRPQHATLSAVARSLGKKFVLVDIPPEQDVTRVYRPLKKWRQLAETKKIKEKKLNGKRR